jgi:hypothetical protein
MTLLFLILGVTLATLACVAHIIVYVRREQRFQSNLKALDAHMGRCCECLDPIRDDDYLVLVDHKAYHGKCWMDAQAPSEMCTDHE